MYEVLFDRVLKEHFDTSDRRTMKTLLALNEEDQNQAMAALASKLYQKIVDKVDDIDFGTIPASKGDITKIGNYQDMIDCIDVIRNIINHYRQSTTQIDTIQKAIENMKASKKIWEKAFIVKSELPITFYNTICLSIVSSVSLLISSSIDFISKPGDEKSFEISFNNIGYNKTKDKLLFENLEKFNKSYAKGEVENAMSKLVNTNATLKEGTTIPESITESIAITALAAGIGGAFVIGTLFSLVIPILHELVSLFYCTKQGFSEYLELQAKLLEFNAEQLKYDYTKSETEIKKIYTKQMKIAEKFRKHADKISIKMNKADKDARTAVQKDKVEKYTIDDIKTTDVPSMTSSSIF